MVGRVIVEHNHNLLGRYVARVDQTYEKFPYLLLICFLCYNKMTVYPLVIAAYRPKDRVVSSACSLVGQRDTRSISPGPLLDVRPQIQGGFVNVENFFF